MVVYSGAEGTPSAFSQSPFPNLSVGLAAHGPRRCLREPPEDGPVKGNHGRLLLAALGFRSDHLFPLLTDVTDAAMDTEVRMTDEHGSCAD
jgi:hypothetical protein